MDRSSPHNTVSRVIYFYWHNAFIEFHIMVTWYCIAAHLTSQKPKIGANGMMIDRRSATPCRQGSKYVSANIRRLSKKVGYKVYHLKRKRRERISTCLQAKFICSLDCVQNFTQQSKTCFLQLALATKLANKVLLLYHDICSLRISKVRWMKMC